MAGGETAVLEHPGTMLYFAIEGARGEGETEPSELAETINERRREVFTG
ncbi:MAG: hypothetical protein H0U53_09905 [Actinobacteria bacterium]|nr:hypothetical protein [Actinomycetota bacterium]